MRKAQAQNVLDEVLFSFGQEIAAIRFDSMFSVSSFQDAHRALTTRIKRLKDFSGRTQTDTGKPVPWKMMWTAVPARDVSVSPPYGFAIGGKAAEDEDLVTVLVDNLNNHNLWLLVCAYEALERFYKNFYGALGYLDRDLWLCSDFGSIGIQDLRNKGLLWFQAQARQIAGKYNIDGILQNLRKSFPQFATAEVGKDANLKMWVDVAALFRHTIVHGQVRITKEELVRKLEKATGLSFSGSKRSVRLRLVLVSRYLLRERDCYRLQVIDRDRLRPPYHGVERPLDSLVEDLCSHACLAYKAAMAHFGHRVFWERQGAKCKQG